MTQNIDELKREIMNDPEKLARCQALASDVFLAIKAGCELEKKTNVELIDMVKESFIYNQDMFSLKTALLEEVCKRLVQEAE